MVAAVIVSVVVGAGCGASGAEIRTAKAAIYVAPINNVLDIAIQVTQRTYPVSDVDIENHKFRTQTQFYNEEGGRESPGANGFVTAHGGSVSLTLIVEALFVGDRQDLVVVKVTPKTYQVVAGSPKPRELLPDDPNLPPWIRGRADTLALEIYKEARRYEAPPQQQVAPGTRPGP
jgi:hypothetical protein